VAAKELVTDVFSNPLVDIEPSAALISVNYTRDNIAPKLLSFELDMDQFVNPTGTRPVSSASLLLRYDETVRFESFDATAITIQSSASLNPAEIVTLSGVGEQITTSSGTTIAFRLLNEDANAVKKIANLAIDKNSTFISVIGKLVTDMFANNVSAIGSLDAMPTSDYVADITAPEILQFLVDMNAGTITLIFDETVKGSSMRPVELTLRDHGDPTKQTSNYTLSGAIMQDSNYWVESIDAEGFHKNTFVHSDDTVITVTLTKSDKDEIKRLSMCSQQDNCYLVYTEFLVTDMAEVPNRILRCTSVVG
jgi:hypothetical protein